MGRSIGAAGLILAGLGLDAAPSIELAISALAAAGVRAFVFPGALLSDLDRLASLTAAARRAVAEAGSGKALLALGGGSVPGFGLGFPSAGLYPLGIAALRSRTAARRSGRALGRAAAAAGIDMVLGPSLDLALDPKNPSGVLDSFGSEPELAGALAPAFIRGLGSSGIAACVGRFPGLGLTCSEAGDGPFQSVCLPAERLEAVEMRLFARSLRFGESSVFVGRDLVPALEPERIPAARSARIIEGRLREALRFKGLVIGDEIGTEPAPLDAALFSALAGCDLVFAASSETALAAARSLEESAKSGRLPAARVVVSRGRLDRLLATRRAASSVDPEALGARIERDRSDSMTVLKGSLGPREGRRLILVFLPPRAKADHREGEAALEALRSRLPKDEIRSLSADPTPDETRGLVEFLAARDPGAPFSSAVALTYDAHFRPAQEGLARLVQESVPDFCLVAMRDPYDAAFFPEARGLAAAYGFSAAGAAAVGNLLAGGGSPRGACPVEVIGLEV